MLFLVFGFVKQARFHLQNIERFAANHPPVSANHLLYPFHSGVPVETRSSFWRFRGDLQRAYRANFHFRCFCRGEKLIIVFFDLLQCHFHFRNFGRHSRHFLTLAKVICRFASRFRAVIFQNMGDLQGLCRHGRVICKPGQPNI